MLWTRVVSSVLLAPFFLLVVYLEAPWFTVLAAGIGGVVAYEYARMTNLIRSDKAWTWRARLSVAAPIAAILALQFGSVLIAALLIAVLTLVFFVLNPKPERRISVQLLVPYAAFPAVALAYVINVGGAISIYWLLAVVWTTDVGAYVIGRTLGGPKLAPSVSPNKTWSGAIGGVVCAAAASTILLLGFGLEATAAFVGLSIILSIISQLGDLFESGLKRRFAVKDSGALIPGHGGVMDRFDGLWAAAPALAGVCIVTGGGIQSW